jgi:hypothetical protein
MRARALATVLALIGIAFAAYVEYGTARAADIERSFALFIFEAGPWALLLVLALAAPFVRTLVAMGFVLLALDVYAYYAVFVTAQGQAAAVIYLYKPFFGLALIAVGMLAAFLATRPKPAKG